MPFQDQDLLLLQLKKSGHLGYSCISHTIAVTALVIALILVIKYTWTDKTEYTEYSKRYRDDNSLVLFYLARLFLVTRH